MSASTTYSYEFLFKIENTIFALEKIGNSAFIFNSMSDCLQRFGNGFNLAVAPCVALDSSMKDLSSVSGQTANPHKPILSQLSPEIAKCPDALRAMADSAAITPKLKGGNVAAATSVLTTEMNQFQVSTVNNLANTSKTLSERLNPLKGALPFLQTAMTATQVAANMLSIVCDLQTLRETALGKAILWRARASKEAMVSMWGNIKALFSSQAILQFYHNSILFGALMWQVFKNRAKSATQSIYNNAKSLVLGFSSLNLYSLGLGIASVSTYAFSTAIRSLSKAIYAIPIIGWIAAGISLLVAGFTLLWNKSEKFRQVIFTIWEVVKTIFYNIGVVIKGLYNNIIKPYVMFWFNLYKSLAMGIWSALKWCWDMITQGLCALGNIFVSSWSWISTTVMGVILGIGGFFCGVWDWMSEKTSGVTDAILEAFNWIAEPIKKVFTGIGDFFILVWDKIIEGLSKPFKWIQELWNKIFPKDQFKSIGDAIAVGKQKGTESWNNSQKAKKEESSLGKIANTTALIPSITSVVPLSSGTSYSSADVKTSGNVNLNNVKGTSSYGAITAKLNPKSFAGLGGGIAKFAMGMAVVGGIALAPPINTPTPENHTTQEYRELKKENKIQFAKFCENVVINVPQGTTRAQVDAILKELMQKINAVG